MLWYVMIFFSSDARHMASDVDNALQDIVSSQGNMDKNAAHDYLKRLRTRGRYSCDVWSWAFNNPRILIYHIYFI